MVTVRRSLPLWSLLLLLGQSSVSAQIVPDTTLGAEASQLQLQGSQTTITGGANRSAALFHSFDQFNVANGEQVMPSWPSPVALAPAPLSAIA